MRTDEYGFTQLIGLVKPDMKRKLQMQLVREGRSYSAWLREAVTEYLTRTNSNKKGKQ